MDTPPPPERVPTTAAAVPKFSTPIETNRFQRADDRTLEHLRARVEQLKSDALPADQGWPDARGRLGELIPLKLFAALEYFGFDYHLNSFIKGVIDTRDLIWFAAVTFIFMLLAQFRLQSANLMQER